VDSERFPDTIEEVITQKYHFTTYWDGTMSHIVPSEETYQAVQQELYNDRLDANILFFTADGYNVYCIPGYIYGDHYFGY
jgi:spore germination cell wall hydrolase CwlJ-like protein